MVLCCLSWRFVESSARDECCCSTPTKAVALSANADAKLNTRTSAKDLVLCDLFIPYSSSPVYRQGRRLRSVGVAYEGVKRVWVMQRPLRRDSESGLRLLSGRIYCESRRETTKKCDSD